MIYIRILAFIIFFFLSLGILIVLKKLQVPSRIRKAEELLNSGDLLKASEIVKIVLEKKKDFVPARYLRAQILTQQSQYLLAIAELNTILTLPEFQKHVNEVDIHYRLAELYSLTQQWQKEIEEYKIILTFNPEDIHANHRVGHALYNKKRYKEARDYLAKAYESDPTKTDSLLPLGISCFNLNEFDKAEYYLLRAMENSPTNMEAPYFLGTIFKGKKDFENAIRMLETSKKESKYYLMSLFKLGEIYFENDHHDKAISILEEGIGRLKGDDDDALAYRYLLAECYELENKIKEAMYHWEQIARKNPNYRSTRLKIEDYSNILNNENLKMVFTSSLEDLQPMIVELISGLNYNIVSRKEITHNEYEYKAFNIKRINEPPILVHFVRTTREITEGQLNDFQKRINLEKCKSGIFITTSKYSTKAKAAASTKSIELYDAGYISKAMEKIRAKVQKK